MVLLCGAYRHGAHLLLCGHRRAHAQGRKGKEGSREKGREEIEVRKEEKEEVTPRRAERPRKNTGLRFFFEKAVDKPQKICYIN